MGKARRIALAGLVIGLTGLPVASCSGGRPAARASSAAAPTSGSSTSTSSATTSTTTRPSPTRSTRSPSPTPKRSSTSARPSGPPATTGGATVVLRRMSEAQRVGQLFMVGTPATAVSQATLSAISRYHVGNIMLTGRSHAGTATPYGVVQEARARVTQASTAGVSLFVATDQEGGAVQVLNGPGISDIPSALTQGTWSTGYLRSAAAAWGRQLRACGVNVDLAPVVDTVPGAEAARHNPPIGVYAREYGYTPSVVADHGDAFALGMADAGVAATAKHFPGLGRVSANTDTSSGVTDTVTRRGDAYLEPFAAAVSTAGVPFVMVSTAYYSRLDSANPAVFSSFVIGSMLRGDLHFGGVVISDDLGAARQVAAWSPGQRAVRFLDAGGDMVLTVDPTVLPAMYDAVLARAERDSRFRAKVDAAALRVLTAKEHRHLLGP